MDAESLTTFLTLVAVFFLGYIYREIRFMQDLHKLEVAFQKKVQLDNAIKAVAILSKQVVYLNHEVVDDIHYFYCRDDGSFAGQGKTFDDAAKHFAANCGANGMGYFINIIDGKKYCFVENKCVEVGNA